MKNIFKAILLALLLSVGGISEAQVKSQFPILDFQNAVAIEFGSCEDIVFSIVSYSYGEDTYYYAYEVSNTTFAVVELSIKTGKAIAIYVLRPDKSVYKFTTSEFNKVERPCKTIETLKLNNDRDIF